MKNILTLCCLLMIGVPLLFGADNQSASEKTVSDKPNVIIIMTDDQGYADIGCFGAKGFTTPHLDQLAKEGRRFTNFYAGSTICSPSRAALLTGCYPQRVGIDHFVFFPVTGENPGPGKTGLHPDEYTLAEMFKDSGYQTACVGKWHLGDALPFLPLQQGFDTYFGLPYSNDMTNGLHLPLKNIKTGFPPLPLYEGNKIIETDPDQRFLTRRYTERAVEFIKQNKSNPFFLYLPHSMPHIPLHPHPDFVGKSENGIYGDVIQEIDWSVGQIMATLRENGLQENTLIIFTSDNGPWLTMGTHGGSALPLRDGKQTKYDGGHHVPCIMSWPKEMKANTVGEGMISTIDLLPSLAALIGAKLPSDRKIDGVNAWAYLSGKRENSPRDTYFYNTKVVRQGPWKLFLPGKYPELDPEKLQNPQKVYSYPRLFNLEDDITETTELQATHPEVVAKLTTVLRNYERDIKNNARPLGDIAELEERNAPPPDTTGLPNILWITSEDICPDLGCYGHPDAVTPTMDKLASQGMKYATCWSNFPVCSAARTSLLMGIAAPTLGAHHQRSMVNIPNELKPFPEILRKRGYYTTNNTKTDYNVDVDLKKIWDQCNKQAHWKNRGTNQPFFAVFNIEISHESQIRNENTLALGKRHDPEQLKRIPPYYPNDSIIRKDLAQYHDRITQADEILKHHLDDLEAVGLADDTIVFFFGDNGNGMPRGKRIALDTGLQVPCIVRIPEKYKSLAPPEYQEGGTSDRLISFIDFGPSILSLAGVKSPESMQGKPFMGSFDTGPQPYIFGFRDRMDERYDCSRSIRSNRFLLSLNFYPSILPGAKNDYMFQTPTTQRWRQLFDEGNLPPHQSFFFETKPFVELYDIESDPFQICNLAGKEEFKELETKLQTALLNNLKETCDWGIIPEAVIHQRSQQTTPYEMGKRSKQIIANNLHYATEVSSKTNRFSPVRTQEETIRSIVELANQSHELPRYWGTIGLLNLLASSAGTDGSQPTAETAQLYSRFRELLSKQLEWNNLIVRIPAAEAMGRFGTAEDVTQAAKTLYSLVLDQPVDMYLALPAMDSLDSFFSKIPDDQQRKRIFEAVPSFDAEPRVIPAFEAIFRSINKKSITLNKEGK